MRVTSMDKAKKTRLRLLSVLTFSLAILSIYSCGVTYPTYSPPAQASFNPQDKVITINKGFDEVWSALIEYASSTFFAIKSFEKASGLLTLEFGSGNPSEFVDCGHIKSVTINYSGPLVPMFGRTGYANLTGSMNIFVKPVSDNITEVKINARYILQAKDGPYLQTWAFDTGGFDTKQIASITVTCQPTHKAERTILDGVDQIAHKSKVQ